MLNIGKLKVWTDENQTLIDQKTIAQAMELTKLDFVKGVALMPDAHVGLGSTIGSVILTQDAIIPSAVGVDISCGMSCTNLPFIEQGYFDKFPEKKQEVYDLIRRTVPSGFPCTWSKIPDYVSDIWDAYLKEGYQDMKSTYPDLVGKNDVNQLGTLGSGNHFIEISEDSYKNYYLVLHSGSRGIGNRIGQFFIRKAKEECRNRKIKLPNSDLAYLEKGTQYYDDYLTYVQWAAKYAEYNRMIMKNRILFQLQSMFNTFVKGIIPSISCNHNFIKNETHYGACYWVTRKGAVSASYGEKGIIPGSMGACTYLTEGLGNEESFKSSSHGAGRMMGRSEAKKCITMEQHESALAGIVCDRSAATLDESPSAYKDIDLVMDAQKDLTRPYRKIKQIISVKGQE